MKRKEFIEKSIGAILVTLPAYSLVGCSSSDDAGATPDPTPTGGVDCSANGTATTIGTNHGHTLTVSKDDVDAGVRKTYEIQGTSAHPHSVTITAANFTSLQGKTASTVTSTTDADHSPSVSVSCA